MKTKKPKPTTTTKKCGDCAHARFDPKNLNIYGDPILMECDHNEFKFLKNNVGCIKFKEKNKK